MKRLLIDHNDETKTTLTAVMADGRLKEVYVNRAGGSQIGLVALGVVRSVLPSKFVFIDVGGGKNAFMNTDGDSRHYKEGRTLLVQVQKDATGTKGPAVSETVNINGRLAIVYCQNGKQIPAAGVSQKIVSKTERKRLRGIAEKYLPEGFGAVMRTNSEGHAEDEIAAEIERLVQIHRQIKKQVETEKAPAVLYRENPLLNDILSEDVAEIITCGSVYDSIKSSVAALAPELAERVIRHENAAGKNVVGLFEAYGASLQLELALKRRVSLPCGGFVFIEQTEACVIVDVNTGKFPGRHGLRETVLQTNLEAAKIIAEQIALRNLSGMIVVDFIDMHETEDKQSLVRFFSDELKKDRIKTSIIGMTELGLMQVTRKKTREPLSRLLECDCPHCKGTGRIRIE
ncbi:MAG: ribonuclease E/G [Defluviitaleaceae bacterium]|nr:ribonuclease E/G [Defluviitaleaceae bacterium]